VDPAYPALDLPDRGARDGSLKAAQVGAVTLAGLGSLACGLQALTVGPDRGCGQ